MKTNVYQMVTDRIIAQLQKGEIPWQKPWSANAEDLGAINYVSRKSYSQLNQMLLGKAGEWLTFKQIQALGGKINKGAKAGMVVFFTQTKHLKKVQEIKDGNMIESEVLVMFPVLRYYNVFHIDDTTGIETKIKEVPAEEVQEPIQEAEDIINGYLSRESALKFQNNIHSGKAYYSPSKDCVVVPMISQYEDANEYYSTTFHELVHSTSHESRLNRKCDKVASFGSADYSREELVAEIGSAMLCSHCGLDSEKAFKNSVAYIQGWLKALKNDEKMIVWAASRSEKAAKYIIGINDVELNNTTEQ